MEVVSRLTQFAGRTRGMLRAREAGYSPRKNSPPNPRPGAYRVAERGLVRTKAGCEISCYATARAKSETTPTDPEYPARCSLARLFHPRLSMSRLTRFTLNDDAAATIVISDARALLWKRGQRVLCARSSAVSFGQLRAASSVSRGMSMEEVIPVNVM